MLTPPVITLKTTQQNQLMYVCFGIKLLVVIISIQYFLGFNFSHQQFNSWLLSVEVYKFIPICGMIFSVVMISFKPVTILPKMLTIALTIASILGLFISVLVMFSCDSRCIPWIGILPVLPVLSYIFLRQKVPYHSKASSWLGEHAMELLVCSQHVFLAKDGNGILVLLPEFPLFINLILSTLFFLWLAHHAHSSVINLCLYILPNDLSLVLRNIICMFVMLLPLAVLYYYYV